MSFNPKLLELFTKIGVKKSFNKRRILFFEVQKARDMLFLLSGCVRLYRVDGSGNEITIHFLKPMNFIAEMPVFEGLNYPASAVFESHSDVIYLDFEVFKEHCLSNPEVNLLLVRSLMGKIRDLERMIDEYVSYDVPMRLIAFLLQNQPSLNQYSQKLIAQMIGTTPETLSRTLRKFKQKGLLTTIKGKIELLDIRQLEEEKKALAEEG